MNITDVRTALAEALEGAGFRVYTDLTKVTPPCAAIWAPDFMARATMSTTRTYGIPVLLIAKAGNLGADLEWIEAALAETGSTSAVAAIEACTAGDFITVADEFDITKQEIGGAEYLTCTLRVTVAT